MSFLLRGTIKSVPILKQGRQECLGLMQGFANRFSIKISEKTFEDGQMFAETVLHELLHLYFWMLRAKGVKGLSVPVQHEILEEITPVVLSRIAIILARKKK